MNCNQPDHYWLNNDVRKLLKKSNKNHIIGIDRGERNLIYVTIINSDGVIVARYVYDAFGNQKQVKIGKSTKLITKKSLIKGKKIDKRQEKLGKLSKQLKN